MTSRSFTIHQQSSDGLFRYEQDNGTLSPPMSWEALGRELGLVAAAERERTWGKPLAHAVKRSDGQPASVLYEISGGKVQRIASSAAERNAQQVAELALLMGLEV